MPIGILFWVLMILAILCNLTSWPGTGGGWKGYSGFGFGILLWVLLALLGWHAFGPILQR